MGEEKQTGVYLQISNLEKELDKLGENPKDEDLIQREICTRFLLASSYVIVGDYDKAVAQFNQIRERIPPAGERRPSEDGLNMVVVHALFDIHLQRKAEDPGYKPQEDYDALAVATGLYGGKSKPVTTRINLLPPEHRKSS